MDNVDEDLTEEILLLGIYDNIHDFKDCILFFLLKQNYFKLIDLIGLKNKIISGGNLEIKKMYDKIENDSINELKILNGIIKKFKCDHKNIFELKKTIISNYYKIFDEKISDDDILKIRHLLYFLIQNEDESLREKIFNIITNFLTNIILDHKDIKLDEIKLKINDFKKNDKNENLTYPFSYFDDMTDGLYTQNYDYHIINLNKKDIDGAKTMSPQKQIYNNLKETIDQKRKDKEETSIKNGTLFDEKKIKRNNIEIKNENAYSIGFTVNEAYKLNFYNTKYYLNKENKITCEYTDTVVDKNYSIQISLTSNEISFLSKLIEKICQIFDDYWNLIKSKTFDTLPNSEFNWLEKYIKEYLKEYSIEYKKEEDKLIRDELVKDELVNFIIQIVNFINKINEYISVKYYFKKDSLKDDSLFEENEIKHLCQGLVVYILTGTKRFGDWIQMKLSKKLYFMLQTKDYLCRAFGILIGAPVENIFKDEKDEKDETDKKDKKKKEKIEEDKIIIYNYNPSKDFIASFNINEKYKKFGIKDKLVYKSPNKPFGELTIVNRELDIKDIEKGDKMIISTSDKIKIELNISRYWFKKYAKYKHKYIELKTKLITKNHEYLQNQMF